MSGKFHDLMKTNNILSEKLVAAKELIAFLKNNQSKLEEKNKQSTEFLAGRDKRLEALTS